MHADTNANTNADTNAHATFNMQSGEQAQALASRD